MSLDDEFDDNLDNDIQEREYERWVGLQKVIYGVIDRKEEIPFLEHIHQNLFNKSLSEYYLNFSLDRYNFYKIIEKDDFKAKYKSIMDTMYHMSEEKYQK